MSGAVQEFYRNKNILLTGGTGFFGKIIIEKLLRSCDVRGIYLIVRPKKGLSPEERLHNLFEEPVFEKIKEKDANCIKKIYTIEGDLSKKGIGLEEEDRELIKHNTVTESLWEQTFDNPSAYSVSDSIPS